MKYYISINKKTICLFINQLAQNIDLRYNDLGDSMRVSINLAKEAFPPHKHKNYEIVIYMKGSGTIQAAGQTIAVCPGKIIILPPGTVHSSSNLSADFEEIYINGDLNHGLYVTSPVVIADNPQNEGLLLAKMIYTNRYSNHEYLTALINAFTHFLLQSIKMEDDIYIAINKIIETISSNFYDCNIKINALLKESGYAEDYIRAQFKKFTGKTPVEFLTVLRINHARYMIDLYKNSFPLAYIAEKCCYADYVYFSRKLKQVMGISPQKYMAGN